MPPNECNATEALECMKIGQLMQSGTDENNIFKVSGDLGFIWRGRNNRGSLIWNEFYNKRAFLTVYKSDKFHPYTPPTPKA